MLYWILLIVSLLLISLIAIRRMRVTYLDSHFQKSLAEEEAIEQALDEAFEEAEEKPVVASDESPRQLFTKADVHFSRNELDEAEAALLTLLELEANHLEAHHKLGLLYMKKNAYPQAELYFSRLINLKKDPIFYSNLGAALYHQQRLVEAAEAYENALAMDDKRAERFESLAQVYHELGELDKALGHFEQASLKKPRDINLKFVLADYYESQKRFEECAAQLQRVLELQPYNEDAHTRLEEIKKQI